MPFRPGRTRCCPSQSRGGNLAPVLPETPLASFHDPEAEKEIGNGVSQHAGRQVFRPIRDPIEERSRQECHDPIRLGMGKAEPDRRSPKREPGKGPERDRVEFFVHEIAEQESAPKDFLNQRYDDDQPQETKDDRGPVCGRLAGKDLRIKTNEARRKAQEFLGRDPDGKGQDRYRGRKNNSPRRVKFILAPEPNEERPADNRLSREDPIDGRIEPKGSAGLVECAAQEEEDKKGCHRQQKRYEFAGEKFVSRRIHLVFRLDG